MAVNKQEEGLDASGLDTNSKYRRDLSNAYAALLGDQTRRSFAAFTFEEALDAQIERIEGEGTQIRPNLLDRVSRIESLAVQAVDQIKALPPDNFLKPDPSSDVNTANE